MGVSWFNFGVVSSHHEEREDHECSKDKIFHTLNSPGVRPVRGEVRSGVMGIVLSAVAGGPTVARGIRV